jgi:hypothetical protein
MNTGYHCCRSILLTKRFSVAFSFVNSLSQKNLQSGLYLPAPGVLIFKTRLIACITAQEVVKKISLPVGGDE